MALSGGLPDLQTRQYRDMIEHEMQQRGSFLGGTVTLENVIGAESTWFPKFGALSSYEVTGRNQDIDLNDQTAERRGLTIQLLEAPAQIEAIDMARYTRSIQPDIAESLAFELGRQKDLAIMTALSGTALRELSGSTSNASFDSNNTIAVNSNTFSARMGSVALTGDTGLHEGKILQAIKIMQANYSLRPGDEIFVVAPAVQLTGLKSRVISSDTAGMFQNKAPNLNVPMADQALQGFLGCTFIQYENTGVDGSSDQYVYIFTRKAVKFAVYEDISITSERRLGKKGNPLLIKANMAVGGVRMWEEAVVRVLCDPTPLYAVA